MNDSNEILKLSCDKCKKFVRGTYTELFGNLPSLRAIPKMVCKCGGNICIEFTGKYKALSQPEEKGGKSGTNRS